MSQSGLKTPGSRLLGVFSPHLAPLRHLPASLAGNQPSLGGPVVLRYFSWLVKLLTGMVHFGKQLQLQANTEKDVLEVNETLKMTTCQQQGVEETTSLRQGDMF